VQVKGVTRGGAVRESQSPGVVEFRVLGPIEVIFGGERVSLAGARQEIVLTMLLLEAGHTVAVDLLIDAIWGDSPPATAKSQVHICVSRLRKMLARSGSTASLQTRSAGYMLEIPEGSLDLQRFRDLTAQAAAVCGRDPLAGVAHYRAALEIWRGDACAGIESRITAQAAIRLNESRLTALGDCIDLELALGHHNQLIGELSELVAQHPLWERPRRQLMLALYRSGRRAEALEVFQAARQILLEELGLEPDKELSALHQSILNSDSVLDLPGSRSAHSVEDEDPNDAGESAGQREASRLSPPNPRMLPATIGDFVGRENELNHIFALLTGFTPADAARHNGIHVPIVVLTGRGGVGKTSLALRAAHLLHASFPDGSLYAQLGDGIELAVGAYGILERFLRASGVRTSDMPDGLEERAEMYRSLLAGQRVLVVLDGASNVSQVEPLLPGHPGCAVLITCRTRAASPAGATCLEVGTLDADAGAALLAQVIGPDRAAAEYDAVTTIVGLCEGLPLALRIAAAKLAARPHWRIERLAGRLVNERRRLDELALEKTSIRTMLDLTYQSLTNRQQKLLRRLSLLGPRDFPYWVGGPLLQTDVLEAEEFLEELVVNGLVEARSMPAGDTRYQLHDLVRLYASEAIAASESAAERQASIARYTGCLLWLTTQAHQRYYGGDFYVPHGSGLRYPLPAATTGLLLADPIAWLRAERTLIVAAILLASRAGLDELSWELAVTSVTLFESEPFPDDWRETHLTAMAATTDAGNQRGTAALLFSLGMLATTRNLEEAASLLRHSCQLWEEVGDQHGLALSLHGLAGIERLSGNYQNAAVMYKRVLPLFEQIGDYAGYAAALRCLGQIEMDQMRDAAAEALFRRAISVAEQAESRRDRTQALYYLAELLLHRGDLKQAEQLFQTVCAEAKTLADAVGQGYGFLGLGITCSQLREFGRAADNLRAALTLAERSNDKLLRGRVLLASAEFYAAEGRHELALAQLNKALATFADFGPALVWQARALEFASRIHRLLDNGEEADRFWRSALDVAGGSESALGALLGAAPRVDKSAGPAA
jgi:DNA-binding SARP family transcriptional activator/tetratricopeptide (TPR) repeat protein